MFRVLDPRAVLAIVLLRLELLLEAEARRSGRVPRSAVLGHAETLLAAKRHLIPTKAVRLISCAREPPPGAKLHAVRRKARSERKDSPDRQTARGRDGRFARTECCSAAGSDAQNITKLAPHFSSADGAVTRASRAGAGPLTRFDATGHCPACGGDGSVGVGVVRQRCIKELWFGAIQWPKMRQGAPH